MPIEPAKDVSEVLPFFVIRLLKERDIAVQSDTDVFFFSGEVFFAYARLSSS